MSLWSSLLGMLGGVAPAGAPTTPTLPAKATEAAWSLAERDLKRLQGVHPDLVRVVTRCAAMTSVSPFTVVEGLRSREREVEMVAAGKSQTMNSRHLTGHAVDLAVLDGRGGIDWSPGRYYDLSTAMAAAAAAEGVPIAWGGNWKTLKDLDHWELPRQEYPA